MWTFLKLVLGIDLIQSKANKQKKKLLTSRWRSLKVQKNHIKLAIKQNENDQSIHHNTAGNEWMHIQWVTYSLMCPLSLLSASRLCSWKGRRQLWWEQPPMQNWWTERHRVSLTWHVLTGYMCPWAVMLAFSWHQNSSSRCTVIKPQHHPVRLITAKKLKTPLQQVMRKTLRGFYRPFRRPAKCLSETSLHNIKHF